MICLLWFWLIPVYHIYTVQQYQFAVIILYHRMFETRAEIVGTPIVILRVHYKPDELAWPEMDSDTKRVGFLVLGLP